jgi:hypothetical protein
LKYLFEGIHHSREGGINDCPKLDASFKTEKNMLSENGYRNETFRACEPNRTKCVEVLPGRNQQVSLIALGIEWTRFETRTMIQKELI